MGRIYFMTLVQILANTCIGIILSEIIKLKQIMKMSAVFIHALIYVGFICTFPYTHNDVRC